MALTSAVRKNEELKALQALAVILAETIEREAYETAAELAALTKALRDTLARITALGGGAAKEDTADELARRRKDRRADAAHSQTS